MLVFGSLDRRPALVSSSVSSSRRVAESSLRSISESLSASSWCFSTNARTSVMSRTNGVAAWIGATPEARLAIARQLGNTSAKARASEAK